MCPLEYGSEDRDDTIIPNRTKVFRFGKTNLSCYSCNSIKDVDKCYTVNNVTTPLVKCINPNETYCRVKIFNQIFKIIVSLFKTEPKTRVLNYKLQPNWEPRNFISHKNISRIILFNFARMTFYFFIDCNCFSNESKELFGNLDIVFLILKKNFKVRRVEYAQTDISNDRQIVPWSMERGCSSECSSFCVNMGSRTKITYCTSCCNYDGCNTDNYARASLSKSLFLVMLSVRIVWTINWHLLGRLKSVLWWKFQTVQTKIFLLLKKEINLRYSNILSQDNLKLWKNM